MTTLNNFAAKKKLLVDFLHKVGVRERSGYLTFFYGNQARTRLRGETTDGLRQFSWSKSSRPIAPYGSFLKWTSDEHWRATELVIVEGESDSLTLWSHGVRAIGIPGGSLANCLSGEHLVGIETIYLHREPDAGGHTFISSMFDRLAAIGFAGVVKVFTVARPGVKDPSDLHTADPASFDNEFKAAIARATPVTLPERKNVRPAKPCSCNGKHHHGHSPTSESVEGLGGVDLFALIADDIGSPDRQGKWCCPFHNDSRPSLSIAQKGGKPRWRCFACGAHGDALDWVMSRRGLDFNTAKQVLGLQRFEKRDGERWLIQMFVVQVVI